MGNLADKVCTHNSVFTVMKRSCWKGWLVEENLVTPPYREECLVTPPYREDLLITPPCREERLVTPPSREERLVTPPCREERTLVARLDDEVSSDDDDVSKDLLSELLQSSPVPAFNPL